MTLSRTYVLAVLLLALPLFSFAQTLDQAAENIQSSTAAAYQFQNEGIFGCNQVAGVNISAGTMAAIGGVYVPVNDAAVTLNTGMLVYKECVLRPLQDRLRESAMSALFKKAQTAIQTGREGSSRYPVNQTDERKNTADKEFLYVLTESKMLDNVAPEYKGAVQSTLARNYSTMTRKPEEALKCGYTGNMATLTKSPVNVFEALDALQNPACNPYGAYYTAETITKARVAEALYNQQNELDWGRGFLPLTDNASSPLMEKTYTPASVVQESYQQILGSGVRQLESANDIGQMIGALYAGVTTQIISDSRGLAGISQSFGGQPSYLDQVAKESSQGVIGAAVNAALQILNASRQIEGTYLAAMNAIANVLTQSINQLRATERQCFVLIEPKARDYAAAENFQLDPVKIRTSTTSLAFSQQIIDSQITPLAGVALQNIQTSQRAVGLIDQLIAGVTNTTSLNNQRLALQQLDTLVAQRQLHTQYDAQRAAQQQQDVTGAMTTLVTDTAKAWGDSPDPGVGWCNVNNQNVIRLWAERWKK